jgi:hypothetical protein
MNLLAYSGGETAAGSAIAGLIVLVPFLLFIYGVVCFLVPIFIYRIMRRGTESHQTLRRIEQLLSTQKPTWTSSPAKSVDDWDRTGIYGAAPVQKSEKRVLNLGVKEV